MFDPAEIQIGGILLLALVFGLVQFFKELFNLQGKAVTALSALLGVILMALSQVIQLLPPIYEQAIQIFVTSLAFGLAASGYYKFVNARAPAQEGER